ncbi:mannitol dehydrogenase [Synergistales bacterium]|nr:mannitol dehydrogenase [Synergistales bacterium]
MLRLNDKGLTDKAAWEASGVKLPLYDRASMIKKTLQNPAWLHFGTGNIFRAFIAPLQQRLLNDGKTEVGIIAAEPFDYEIVDAVYKPHDDLALSVGLKADGSFNLELVASVAESIRADSGRNRLDEIAASKSLQIISVCITEKGYALKDMKGDLLGVVKAEMEHGPSNVKHTMSLLAALLLTRFKNGSAPVALLSLDNCSHNGEKLKSSVTEIARAWNKNGFAGDDFIAWLEDEKQVSFPWSMIDKITPRPSEVVRDELIKRGIEGMELLATAKGTYTAPFVNAEIPEYLVIEDNFPAGRPALERAGAYFTDRDTVNNVERMKVTTCLNPLHTALAVCGCLLGYKSIASEMKDSLLKSLVERIGYAEGMPVVVNPGIFAPHDFIKEVLEERFPNPFIPDTPQRIATDTSQKIPIRYGETLKSYMKRSDLNAGNLVGIPLVIAAWFRYLLAVDDELNPMELSGDPMLDELRKGLSGVEAGKPESYKGQLKPFLKNPALFALDLFEAGLGEKIEGYFVSMLAGKQAVLNTLAKNLSDSRN